MLINDERQEKSKEDLLNHINFQSQEIAKQSQEIESQSQEIAKQSQKIKLLEEMVRFLKHQKYSASSEKYVDDNPQGHLFDEASLPANLEEIEASEEDITIPAHQRKKPGKKGINKDLPRERIIYDLSDEEKVCDCGHALNHIGEDITEQLDIIPAQIKVLQHVCKKYACHHCEDKIITAKKPTQPIPKSIASPGLLAHVLTSKFQYHLPLYRQESMLKGLGVDIARNTLSLWVIRCALLLQPLVNLLQDKILAYDIAYSDETTLQVLKEKNRRAESTSYLWAFGGGPPDEFCYIYQYHPGRSHSIAHDFFEGFKGYLHCDGYQAYDTLTAKNNQIIQVGCWYHARRKFADSAKVSKKSGMAHWFLKQIQQLSKIEKYLAESKLSTEASKAYRLSKATPILNKIKAQLDKSQASAPPDSLLGKAIRYTQNQWLKLQKYLDDGRLEISNNRMERAIKPFAVGRKNWLFANSVDGARAAATIFSLVETCKAHEISVYHWLRYVLTRLPNAKTVEEIEVLLPFHFKNKQ